MIVSENKTGVFRSSGTIDISLSPCTEDTYYFTGGTVNGFIGADGGVFHISGGHFTGEVMFNNSNEEAKLEIDLSCDAEFASLEHMIYTNEDSPAIHMTISDNVRVNSMVFSVMGDGVLNYTTLIVNGGYFAVNLRTWANNANEGNVVVSGETEQYSSQENWAADSSVYAWRIREPKGGIGGVNLDGNIDIRDVLAIQRHVSEYKLLTDDALINADTNGDGVVNIDDAIYLQMYLAEYGVVLGNNPRNYIFHIFGICISRAPIFYETAANYKRIICIILPLIILLSVLAELLAAF